MQNTAWKIIKMSGIGVGFAVIVVLLIMTLAGFFHPKVGKAQPGAAVTAGRPVGDARLTEARLITVPTVESAVGTIRAVHETAVASKLLAKVLDVRVIAGQVVKTGDVLVRLDDQDLRAKLDQAVAGVSAAQAARDQAQVEYNRVQGLVDQHVAAPIEFERVQTTLKSADAQLEQAQQARREAETYLEYATILSPLDGVIIDKQVEVGDMVTPGSVLLTLFDPSRMQLVASVRESLTQRLKVGQMIGVQVESLNKTCQGQVSEIVPEAEAASRSFQVKVTGPCPPGMYSGMFGRLLIPLDDEQVLVIPRAAVRQVGQLQLVEVAEQGKLSRRSVQLGREFDDDVEVLAGLKAGESVALPAGADIQK
jgi:RND family efflux transporter MFP subunit